MTTRHLVALASLVCLPFLGLAATYYVSPTGNDSNSGTSSGQAWRTINRVQQIAGSLQAGDQVLFERGGRYPGKLTVNSSGSSSNPIIISAYGSGAAPVISGSILTSGWTQYQGNIWRTSVAAPVKQVWSNGTLMTLARFPNTGWLYTSSSSQTQVSSAGITQGNGYWNGGELVRRTSNWSYERANITNHANGTITSAAVTYSYGSGWGFFLRNKLSALDIANEWYYDAASGYLYFWAPGNANPNNLSVYASVHEHGVEAGWQRQHIRMEGLAFLGQWYSGVYVNGASNVRVTGCSFEQMVTSIKSLGNNCTYSGNTITRTYGTGMSLIETNSLVENNTFVDIALEPGLGENAWGYFGMYMIGSGNTIRTNSFENVGYSGIFIEGNTLVERNVVTNAMAILNDGGGIHFDNVSGAVIQDNIISELRGDLESSSSTTYMCHGIFFGNAVINNTVVQRNTVSRCDGSGIFVDHTLVSNNLQVKDNTLFNNRTQLTITDYSNYNGPGATPPYFKAQYNDVYSGNIMYSVTADQFCMEQHGMHSSTNFVDYGTFTNNKYFNPYNEMSIMVWRIGTSQIIYSLEKWQFERSEDVGSTRSPQRLEIYDVTQVHGSNMITNGQFSSNLSGWYGWPTQGVMTHETGMLDGGSMKVQFTNGSSSPEFYLQHTPTQTSLQNGSWYELRYSTKSYTGMHGNMKVEVKGQSQSGTGANIVSKMVPFDHQRRDMTLVFQSDRTEPGQALFSNRHTESTYWIDNVELYRVSVTPVDPLQRHIIFRNTSSTTASFSTPAGCWSNVAGQQVSNPVSVPPYGSVVLYRTQAVGCAAAPPSLGVKVMLAGSMNWGTGQMRSDLRALGVIPTLEPYTALGLPVMNFGASIAPGLFNQTGSQAIVDWVLLELRYTGSGNAVADRRAALVRADGQVVSTDGSNQVVFAVPVAGKHLAVRHRNHLGVMTANPIESSGITVDLTTQNVALYGTNAMQVQGNVRALWAGDSSGDGMLRYTGTGNDRDFILEAIGGLVPTASVVGYRAEDVNMDGWVKYTGVGNDTDVVLSGIGGVVPTIVREQQLP